MYSACTWQHKGRYGYAYRPWEADLPMNNRPYEGYSQSPVALTTKVVGLGFTIWAVRSPAHR